MVQILAASVLTTFLLAAPSGGAGLYDPLLAYIDPGTGSLIFQAIAAAAAGIVFALRSRLRGWKQRLQGRRPEDLGGDGKGEERDAG